MMMDNEANRLPKAKLRHDLYAGIAEGPVADRESLYALSTTQSSTSSSTDDGASHSKRDSFDDMKCLIGKDPAHMNINAANGLFASANKVRRRFSLDNSSLGTASKGRNMKEALSSSSQKKDETVRSGETATDTDNASPHRSHMKGLFGGARLDADSSVSAVRSGKDGSHSSTGLECGSTDRSSQVKPPLTGLNDALLKGIKLKKVAKCKHSPFYIFLYTYIFAI